jgi:hypothetical protein
MPRMLGRVLTARPVDEQRLPEHGFQLVEFDDEGDLLIEARHDVLLIVPQGDTDSGFEPPGHPAPSPHFRNLLFS